MPLSSFQYPASYSWQREGYTYRPKNSSCLICKSSFSRYYSFKYVIKARKLEEMSEYLIICFNYRCMALAGFHEYYNVTMLMD